jgi:hypothetical protein
MNERNSTFCKLCRGTGFINETAEDPGGQSLDILLTLLPSLFIGFILLILYIFGFLNIAIIKSANLFYTIGGFGFALLIAAGCLHTILRMIFPRKIKCPQCKGQRLL